MMDLQYLHFFKYEIVALLVFHIKYDRQVKIFLPEQKKSIKILNSHHFLSFSKF